MSPDRDDYEHMTRKPGLWEQYRMWAYGCKKHRYCLSLALSHQYRFVCYRCGNKKTVTRAAWYRAHNLAAVYQALKPLRQEPYGR